MVMAGGCLCATGLLLMVILLPLSFQYVDYHEFALLQRSSTGKVYTDEVYSSGRYCFGPDFKMKTFKADAHHTIFEEVTVFSQARSNDSVGLEFKLDIDFTYFIIEDEVGILYEELATNYAPVVESRAKDAIKNTAANIPYDDFFQDREGVSNTLEVAVRERLIEPPSLHVSLGHFFVGRIQIPEEVAQKQLDVKIQIETNDAQEYKKEAQLERDYTEVEVNRILLQKERELKIAESNAELVVQIAEASSKKIVQSAYYEGYADLMRTLNITEQKHKASYNYLDKLDSNKKKTLKVTYLDDTNVVKTDAQS